MKYKSYSKEFKLAVVNEYLVVKKLKVREIQNKYKLSTRVLIYNWVNEYQKLGDQAFIKNPNSDQTSHRHDKKDIETKLLKQENEKLTKELFKKKVENELLKEQLACEKRLTRGINNLLNCKHLKHKCFLIIEKYRKNNKISDIISLLPISFTAYYNWVANKKPKYNSKANLVTLELAINELVTNSATIGKYINSTSLGKVLIALKIKNPNLKCSKTSINNILMKNQIKLLKTPKLRKNKNSIINNNSNKNDLLLRDFSTQRPLEKIGIDGTWFKNLIIADKKMKLLVALATDMHNDKIVGWKVSTSENPAVVLEPV